MSRVQKYRVLYVEDEQETANICKAVLVARNYDVDLAFTGKDGKDQFACGAYDAVLLDYRLPDMDGLELARAMLAEEPSIPIVFITGRGSEKIAAEALALGVSQYVVKDNEDVYTTVLPEVISSVIKRAEDKESLSKCEDRYDRAIAGSQIGLWEWNIKTDEEFYSTQWLQIVGYEDGEFGTDRGAFLRLVHPNDVSAVKESLRAHFENHEPYDIEIRMKHKRKHYIWVRSQAEVFRDKNGEPEYMSGSLTDITVQKSTEEALIASEQMFKDFAESAADRFWEMDKDFRFTYISEASANPSRILSADMVGKTRWELAGIDADSDIWEQHKIDLHAHKAIQDFQYRRVMPGGETFWIRVSAKPLFDKDGNFEGYRGTNLDITARKLAEQKFAESEGLYRALFEGANDGIVIREPGNRVIVDCNQTFAKRLGYERAELIGQSIDNISIDTSQKERDLRQSNLENQIELTAVRTHRRKDGTELPVEISGAVVAIGDRNLVISVVRDISERKNAEATLRQSEMRFRDFAAMTADRFWELDNDFRFTYVSDATETLTFDAEALIGKTHWELESLDLAKGSWDDFRTLLGKREPIRNYPYSWTRNDGSKREISMSANPIVGDDGAACGYRGTSKDITAEVAARKEATAIQQRFFDALEELDVGVILWGADNRFVYCNKFFKGLHETPGTLGMLVPGTEYRELITAIANSGVLNIEQDNLEDWISERINKFNRNEIEEEVVRDGGRAIRTAAQKLDDGGTVIFRFDITELKNKQNEAEAANRAKSEFLASMSHELRTPLNAVLGFGQLLENNPKSPLSEVQLDHTRQIIKGGTQLLELIDQVLELSKIEAGKVSLSVENVVPALVVNDCLMMVRERADKNEITLDDQTNDGDLPILRTDQNRFRQILLNLLSNAVKYNRPGGSVTVTTELAENNFQRISIVDTGIGIPKDRQKEMFEPFNRLGLEAGEIEGTGIGLTITKQIIELLDGRIGFESEEGTGSTFWFELPIAEDNLSSQDEIAKAVISDVKLGIANAQTQTILYIEDNPSNLALMNAVIGRLPNFTMLSAPNAEVGLDLAKNELPELILMDINLPGMDGVEALRKLRSDDATKNIPVIALTAAAMPHEIERGKQAGFEEYITKPINIDEILEAMTVHLRYAVYSAPAGPPF